MSAATEDEQFARVARRLDPGSRLLRAWELKGGVSARVTALEIARSNGHTQKVIVRRHGAVDLKHNPRIAADEFTLLRLLHAAGLATPKPCLVDSSGEIFPTPYVVIEYIEGQPELAPTPTNLSARIGQLATHLARIHAVDCAKANVSFLPNIEEVYTQKLRERPTNLDESLDEGRIRDVLEAVWPVPRRNPTVLLHGDYWPGNVLWRDGQLAAVIDWEDAALGDPLADVANTRLEILWAFGSDAMQRFTRHYQSMTTIDFTHLPYWDLCAALRPASKIAEWAADNSAERRLREGHRLFITQAFAQLPV